VNISQLKLRSEKFDDDDDDDNDNNNNNNDICRKYREGGLETIERRYKTDACISRAQCNCTHRHCQVASIVRQ
jgi:hypothetical protein